MAFQAPSFVFFDASYLIDNCFSFVADRSLDQKADYFCKDYR